MDSIKIRKALADSLEMVGADDFADDVGVDGIIAELGERGYAIIEVTDPVAGLNPDGYTCRPTHVRVYNEDCGDELPWHVDGADNDLNYTVAVWRYGTLAEALAKVGEFVEFTSEDGVAWRWDAERRTTLRRAACSR